MKRAWNNQDLTNKVILVTGVVMAVICLVMGQGLYSVVFIVLMLAFGCVYGVVLLAGRLVSRLLRWLFSLL